MARRKGDSIHDLNIQFALLTRCSYSTLPLHPSPLLSNPQLVRRQFPLFLYHCLLLSLTGLEAATATAAAAIKLTILACAAIRGSPEPIGGFRLLLKG